MGQVKTLAIESSYMIEISLNLLMVKLNNKASILN